ncbi:NAD(P)-dependent oxidoreductase [Bradyrhizobium barranii]|uniref:NAD-dependent epimerase/dehydratase family protein n=1 Tax=Bradyrhizobium TaxID=374 RepID=UPI001FF8D9A0|nr:MULTISPECIES: NAD(P)-dependent oxidoreductase [Bradyrhizobium]MCK1321667.1 NAD(P)-dependent oxidoreductase [Bradyrhizobium sp. 156]MCK1635253.1 NAD(P)-dependent oxidoreductase [Bradyrhizobium sp. 162]WFT92835.1 NAD(P)-dependent oxidoreductase [Bradyrhizobium barranii]
MTRRILVTGATGFIGHYTLLPLRELGFEVHVAGRSRPDDPAVTFHSANLFDPAGIARVIGAAKPSHLLHLAWDTEPGKFWNAPINIDWVVASLALVRAFAEAGGTRAVLAGTCAEYSWDEAEPLDERRSALAPGTLYGVSKDALRRIVEAYAGTVSLSVAWGRIFFLYGPGEKSGRLVSDAIRTLAMKQPFVTTDGLQRRDFMHVEDVARGFAALAASDVRGVVNIASGNAVPVRAILETIAREVGGADLLQLGARPRPADDPPLVEAAVDRLTREVGFVPRHSLEGGLAQTARWWRDQGR